MANSHRMKRFLPALLFSIIIFQLSITECKAQWVTIPDANFVAYLTSHYPACMNGNQMDTTCSPIVRPSIISCEFKNIANLDGVQYFDSLDHLGCSHNQITTIPALPKLLRELNCEYNQLATLPLLPNSIRNLYCQSNNLSSLPVLPAS